MRPETAVDDAAWGARLTRVMKERDETMATLSNSLGISKTAIHKWMRGGTITMGKLIPLGDCLDVDPLWLRTGLIGVPSEEIFTQDRYQTIQARLASCLMEQFFEEELMDAVDAATFPIAEFDLQPGQARWNEEFRGLLQLPAGASASRELLLQAVHKMDLCIVQVTMQRAMLSRPPVEALFRPAHNPTVVLVIRAKVFYREQQPRSLFISCYKVEKINQQLTVSNRR